MCMAGGAMMEAALRQGMRHVHKRLDSPTKTQNLAIRTYTILQLMQVSSISRLMPDSRTGLSTMSDTSRKATGITQISTQDRYTACCTVTAYAHIVTFASLTSTLLWQQWPSACRKRRWCRPPWSAGWPAGRRPHAPRSPGARCILIAAIGSLSSLSYGQESIAHVPFVTWASAPICQFFVHR